MAEFRRFYAIRQVDVKDSIAKLHATGYMKHDGKSYPTRLGSGAVGGLSGIAIRCYVFDGDAIGIDETAFSTPTV